jgi:hypothetical protein
MLKNRTQRLVLFLVIANLIIYGGYFFFLNAIKIKNETISQSVADAEYDRQRDVVLRDVKKVIDETKQDVSLLDDLAISKNGVLDFIKAVEAISKESGVSMEIDVDENEGKGNTSDFILAATMSGSWQNIQKTLALIETMPQKSEITNVVLERDASTAGTKARSSSSPTRPSEWSGRFEVRLIKFK